MRTDKKNDSPDYINILDCPPPYPLGETYNRTTKNKGKMIFWSLLLFVTSGLANSFILLGQSGPPRLKYSVVQGYFKQSNLATDDRKYDAVCFGTRTIP